MLDGWRQAFVLPPGTGGVVALKYAPQAGFRVALVGGLIMAGLLVVLAMLLLLAQARRGGRQEDALGPVSLADAEGPPLGRAAQLVIMLTLLVVSLPLVAGALLGRLTRDLDQRYVTAAATVALVIAAVIALAGASVVVPPAGSEVVAALVVGLVFGRVLGRP